MAKIDYLTAKINQRKNLSDDFYDNLIGPPVCAFFSIAEQQYIKRIITHNKNDVKIKMLNAIMKSKGFSRLSAGTNRIVYRYLDDPSFVLKVAIDRVGLQDNLKEFKNQQYLKPYVCKIFDTTPDGLMATIERVYPITSKEEFKSVEDEVFYVITTKIIGRTVADDIGKAFFRNWGVRIGFGVVLLDYPYIYPIAEEKLFCTHMDPDTNIRCTGMIDYDDSFNFLMCRKCGTRYFASDLEDKNASNDIIMNRGGKIPMKIRVTVNGEVTEPVKSSAVIVKNIKKKSNNILSIKVYNNGETTIINDEPSTKPEEKKIEVQVKKEDIVEEKKTTENVVENDPIPEVKEEVAIEEKEEVVSNNDKEETNPIEDSKEEEAKKEPEIVKEAVKEIIKEGSNEVEDIVSKLEGTNRDKYPAKKSKKNSKSAGKAKTAGGVARAANGRFIASPDTSK